MKIPKGWRLLKYGQRIRKGDKIQLTVTAQVWRSVNPRVDTRVTIWNDKVIRKVKS